MNPEQALADLTEISSQIEAAVVFDEQGNVVGSTLGDASRADQLATAAAELLRSAEEVKPGSTLTQFEIATTEGSLFLVRDDQTSIAATTGGNPTVGLVFYDLKSALRSVKPKPRPPARKKPPAPKKPPADAKKKTAAPRPRKKPDAA
jgi:predicted regulator of Ras-like GTPase activity (Roadblock/LC7/MglB family)